MFVPCAPFERGLNGKQEPAEPPHDFEDIYVFRIYHHPTVPTLLRGRDRGVRQEGIHLQLPYNAVNATGIHRPRRLGILGS